MSAYASLSLFPVVAAPGTRKITTSCCNSSTSNSNNKNHSSNVQLLPLHEEKQRDDANHHHHPMCQIRDARVNALALVACNNSKPQPKHIKKSRRSRRRCRPSPKSAAALRDGDDCNNTTNNNNSNQYHEESLLIFDLLIECKGNEDINKGLWQQQQQQSSSTTIKSITLADLRQWWAITTSTTTTIDDVPTIPPGRRRPGFQGYQDALHAVRPALEGWLHRRQAHQLQSLAAYQPNHLSTSGDSQLSLSHCGSQPQLRAIEESSEEESDE